MENKEEKKLVPGLVKKFVNPAKQKAEDTAHAVGDVAKKAVGTLGDIKDDAIMAVTEKMKEKKLTRAFVEQLETLPAPERTYLYFEQKKKSADIDDAYVGRYMTIGSMRVNILQADKEILDQLQFPKKQPVATGKIYIEHPLKPKYYLPYDQYFDIIAREQREEIEGALLALGAQVYTFEYWEYQKDTAEINKSTKGEAKAAKEVGASTGSNFSIGAEKTHQVMEKTRVDLKPQAPKKPKLQWLKDDPKWTGIIERCLSGAGGTWEYTFECSKNTSFSLEDAKNLDGAIAKLQTKLIAGDAFQSEFNSLRQRAFHFNVIF